MINGIGLRSEIDHQTSDIYILFKHFRFEVLYECAMLIQQHEQYGDVTGASNKTSTEIVIDT